MNGSAGEGSGGRPGPAVAGVLARLAAADTATVPATYDVDRGEWRSTLSDLAVSGATYLDFLTAVDRPADGVIEVVAHVAEPGTWWHAVLRTRCDRADPHVDSVVEVHPGADWHERETHEMFGVVFDGHPDLRPLLLAEGLGLRPLRKDTVLAARVVRPWPGASDPADSSSERRGNPSRRRQPPPGVPSDWLRDVLEPGDRS